jgi:hypothetical protein
MDYSLVIGSFASDISKVIDPTKPLMKQVWSLNYQQYLDLVNSSHWLFVESPRMFEYNLLEATSHNKWYHKLILHMAFSIYLLSQVNWHNVSLFTGLVLLMLGMFSFSLLEYGFYFIVKNTSFITKSSDMCTSYYMAFAICYQWIRN